MTKWDLALGTNCDNQMGSEKFGALQRLHAAYQDDCLEAVKEAWMDIDPDFDTNMDTE